MKENKKLRSHNTSYRLIEVVTKAGLTVLFMSLLCQPIYDNHPFCFMYDGDENLLRPCLIQL